MFRASCIWWNTIAHKLHYTIQKQLNRGLLDGLMCADLDLVPHHLPFLKIFLTFSWPCRMSWDKWACKYWFIYWYTKDFGSVGLAQTVPRSFTKLFWNKCHFHKWEEQLFPYLRHSAGDWYNIKAGDVSPKQHDKLVGSEWLFNTVCNLAYAVARRGKKLMWLK